LKTSLLQAKTWAYFPLLWCKAVASAKRKVLRINSFGTSIRIVQATLIKVLLCCFIERSAQNAKLLDEANLPHCQTPNWPRQ